MNPFRTQARSLAALLVVFATALGPACGQTAEEIMEAARKSPMGQQASLRAQLRNDDGKLPVTITLRNGVVSYAFANPEQEIQLVLKENGSELRERIGDRSVAVKPARFDQRIRNTAISYEDLALNFLYWPRPKLLGTDTVKLRKAWKIEIQAPKGKSQYGVARIWIDQQSGAALRIEAYNAQGRKVKAFEMISAKPVDGRWMLKTMRVDVYDPASGRVVDEQRTHLEVLGSAKP